MACAYDVELAFLNIAEGLDQAVEILTGVKGGYGQSESFCGGIDLWQLTEETIVSLAIDNGDITLL